MLGEARATFGTVTPIQVVPGETIVYVSSLAPIYWWRHMQWFLIVPATLAMIISLLRGAESRISSAAINARGSLYRSSLLERIAIAAGQVMVCCGASAVMYAHGTGNGRGVLFALGVCSGLVAFAAVSRALVSAAALTPGSTTLRSW